MGTPSDTVDASSIQPHVDGPAVDVRSHRQVEPADNLALPSGNKMSTSSAISLAGIPASEPSVPVESGAFPEDSGVGATVAAIEMTRVEMTGTIQALKEKLNPQAIMEHARETVRETAAEKLQVAGDAVRGAVDHAKQAAKQAAKPALENARGEVQAAGVWTRQRLDDAAAAIQKNPRPVIAAAVGLIAVLFVVWRKRD